MNSDKKSPMLLQYEEIKAQYKDHILMYRVGDFYEMFWDDAQTVSKELNLTLTSKSCGNDEKMPMCGVPYHSCDPYIARLIEKGYKVAICEQNELVPKPGKKVVDREVIKIITPGTVTLGAALDDTKNNFLASLYSDETGCACAFFDIAQNTVNAIYFDTNNKEKQISLALNEFSRYSPREIITNISKEELSVIGEYVLRNNTGVINTDMIDIFKEENKDLLNLQFKKNNTELGIGINEYHIPMAVGALIAYLKLTQKTLLQNLTALNIYNSLDFLSIDANSRRNLELCETMRTMEKKGTLLWVLDKTKTSTGARLLRRFISKPLTNVRAIAKRQSAVIEFYNSNEFRDDMRSALSNIQDIERILSRIIYSGGSPKDLKALSETLMYVPLISELLSNASGEKLTSILSVLNNDVLPVSNEIYSILDKAIQNDPPATVREGGFIAQGYNAELDELNMMLNESKDYLKKIENTEKELTGIKTMHIGYSKIFGYYFEVSKTQIEMVPERYIRKQTLTTGERYITEELKDMESRILGAKDRKIALELELYKQITDFIKERGEALQLLSDLIAEIDVFASLAEVAVRNNYVCPLVDYSDKLIIKDGRHPVVEAFTEGFFVPNDADLDTQNNRMAIITGPNMAGKSTYMRQCALIVIMAQIGSFVPAKEAQVGIVDKIFTRVGASDDLSTGQSTFMLEMNEVAYILKNATKKSLIIYDEIGRGTSTYDGMSIAKAVIEYTAGKKCGAKTLFATHYHQLSALENTLEGVKNFNIAAKKRGDSIVFLRKIVPGSVDESYGIEVAKLAGVPDEVIKNARETLKELESEYKPEKIIEQRDDLPMFDVIKDQLIDELKSINVDTLTPIEALGKLYELSKSAKEI